MSLDQVLLFALKKYVLWHLTQITMVFTMSSKTSVNEIHHEQAVCIICERELLFLSVCVLFLRWWSNYELWKIFCADTLDWSSNHQIPMLWGTSNCSGSICCSYNEIEEHISRSLILIVSLAGFIQVIKGKLDLM